MSNITEDQIEALLIALLSVNKYSTDKVAAALPGLRAAGLTDPPTVLQTSVEEVTQILVSSGYDRGRLTVLMASRLQKLMRAIYDNRLNELPAALKLNDRASAIQTLVSVPGIGPRVALIAWSLLLAVVHPR